MGNVTPLDAPGPSLRINLMPNKSMPKATPLTLQHFEKFARAIQEDFRSIDGKVSKLDDKVSHFDRTIDKVREDMATKNDLEELRGDMASRTSKAEDSLSERIEGLKYAKEIDELRERVQRVEKKLHIKPAA